MANSMLLVERFIRMYGLDADPCSRSVQEWVQGVNEVAREAAMLVAVCDLTQERYCFQESYLPVLDYLAHRSISLKELKMLIHEGEHKHFTNALHFGLSFFVKNQLEDVGRLELNFECRMRDKSYGYHNVHFKYRVMRGKLPGQQPVLVLRIAAIRRMRVCIPPKAVYIVDVVSKLIVKAIGPNRLKNYEIEHYRHLKLGNNLSEAADKAGVSYSSIKRYRQNLYFKTETSSDMQLGAVLESMNLN